MSTQKKLRYPQLLSELLILERATNPETLYGDLRSQYRTSKDATKRIEELKAKTSKLKQSRARLDQLKKKLKSSSKFTRSINRNLLKELEEQYNKLNSNTQLARFKRQIINKIKTFQSTPAESITLDIPDRYKKVFIKLLQENLKIRPNYNTVLTFDLKPPKSLTITEDSLANFQTSSFENIQEYDAEASGAPAIYVSLNKTNRITISQTPRSRARRGGAFFKYLNKSKLDLTIYDIYSKVETANYKTNCLIKAFQASNQYTDQEIETLKTLCLTRNIPQCKLKEIAIQMNTTIKLIKINQVNNIYQIDRHTVDFNKGQEKEINLVLVDDHYFINNKSNYTKFTVENYNQTKDLNNFNNIVRLNPIRRKNQFMNSSELITLILNNKQTFLTEINLTTNNILDTQYYHDVDTDIKIMDEPELFTRPVEIKTKVSNYSKIYYADSETYSKLENNKINHKPFMMCVRSINDDQTENKYYEKTFLGEQCGKYLLNVLKDKSLTYFHNLSYDFQAIVKYLCITDIIQTGTRIKMVKGFYDKKYLTFKDSYSMLSMKLKDFPKTFNLKSEKEVMPYSLYNENNTKYESTEDIQEALKHIEDKDKQTFLKLSKPYTINNRFYLTKYAEQYCKMDCQVLQEGFETFKQWVHDAFQLNVYDFVSLPSLAYRYLYEQNCFQDVHELSGPVRLFVQKCIKGGRVMTRDNLKYHLKLKISDFDAVSLYPSAMARMDGFLKGTPKKIQANQLNLDFLNKQSGYYIKIRNVKLNKKRHFPLQSVIENQVRRYTNTINQDLYIDDIALKDLITFQEAEFQIVEGYYYNEGFNKQINKTMTHCFDTRVKKQEEGNSIEQVYKLLMNAAYGKMIQKEITTKLRFSNSKKKHDKFVDYNHNFIKEYTQIANNKYVYKVEKSVNKHFNLAHIGAHVLSWSKRIMNEVMCLAEDNNLNIYYQDTDSMHIEQKDIDTLSLLYLNKYGKKLIGKGMGQFHTDFSVKDIRDDNEKIKDLYAAESIFLGKKSYIDDLVANDESQNQYMKEHYHIRLKGITIQAIKAHQLSPMELYKSLYNGDKQDFNLALSKPMFKKNKDFMYETLGEFNRSIEFNSKKSTEVAGNYFC